MEIFVPYLAVTVRENGHGNGDKSTYEYYSYARASILEAFRVASLELGEGSGGNPVRTLWQ